MQRHEIALTELQAAESHRHLDGEGPAEQEGRDPELLETKYKLEKIVRDNRLTTARPGMTGRRDRATALTTSKLHTQSSRCTLGWRQPTMGCMVGVVGISWFQESPDGRSWRGSGRQRYSRATSSTLTSQGQQSQTRLPHGSRSLASREEVDSSGGLQ